MNAKEMLLISNLRKNSRASLTQISKTTRIPISTLFDMLRRSSTIKRHTCLPDFGALGWSVRAVFLVDIASSQKEDFRTFLTAHPHLNNLFKVNNGYDFLFEVVYQDLHALEKFNELIEERFSVQEKQVHYIIEEVAREEFLSDPTKCKLFNLDA